MAGAHFPLQISKVMMLSGCVITCGGNKSWQDHKIIIIIFLVTGFTKLNLQNK